MIALPRMHPCDNSSPLERAGDAPARSGVGQTGHGKAMGCVGVPGLFGGGEAISVLLYRCRDIAVVFVGRLPNSRCYLGLGDCKVF